MKTQALHHHTTTDVLQQATSFFMILNSFFCVIMCLQSRPWRAVVAATTAKSSTNYDALGGGYIYGDGDGITFFAGAYIDFV